MGCCLTTTTTTTTNKTSKTNPDVPPNHRHRFPESNPNGRAPSPPPPPPLEEETVKEMLSETPIPKPPPIPTANDSNEKKNPHQQPVVGEVKIEPMAVITPAEEIVSEVSGMYSFSDSFSTVTEKREDDGEVTQRIHRSPSKVPRKRPISSDLARGKEKGVRSPARRSEPSPVKRTHVTSRSVQGRTMMTTPRNAIRRDPGECSGRRSRSPVARGEAEPRRPLRYKSPALTQAGRSGGRRRAAKAESGGETEKPNDEVSPEGTTESLENPLVSLECFIFL